MKDAIASLIGVDELTVTQVTYRIGSIIWLTLCILAKFVWAGAVWLWQAIENNSHLIHEWASTGRHARGNVNGNAGNMIRHARNMVQPADKVAMVGSLVIAVVSFPVGLLAPAATYLVFFHNADELEPSSTVLGYLGSSVSIVLSAMLFCASLMSSNRWRKKQFRE